MIEMNLLPPEYRPKEAPKFVMPEIPIQRTLAPAAAVIIGIQLLASGFAFYQTISLGMVKGDLSRMAQEESVINKLKDDTSKLKTRLNRINMITEQKYRWYMILNAISDSMTRGVWLTGLSVSGDKSGSKGPKTLKLNGSVIAQGEETAYIGKFIMGLKAHPLLKNLFLDIELSTINQKKIREFDVYDFSLLCPFIKEAEAGR